jgi:acyl-homoserine-lactone acylase
MKCVAEILLTAVLLTLLTGCNADSGSSNVPPPARGGDTNGDGDQGGDGNGDDPDLTYDVSVRRTSFGVPHIRADDFGSMGYGYGYVHAQDNLCVLLEDLITIRGERARYFGRSGPSYQIVANGSSASPVDSDFFWKLLATDEAIAGLKNDIVPEAEAATRGFVAGFNRYVREIKGGEHTGRHEACRDAEWLLEIGEDDMYRRYFRLGLLASSSVFVRDIATAQPPGPANPPAPVNTAAIAGLPPADLPFPLGGELPIGSNMYALGPKATANNRSMLFGNPHFPWTGTERLYLSHLQVGDTDIMGTSLYGVPAVLIGFNDKFAWSHTVSTAYRFSFYELTLNPSDPTQYLYDGECRPMQEVPIQIEVLEDNGETTTESRTLYRSHFGPMLEFAVSGVTIFEWSFAKAYTLRDANAENTRLINQFYAWNKAQSLGEFISLHASVLGVPWVNTAATGPGESAYYGDVTVVPNVPDSKVQQCTTALSPALGQLVPGLPLLDGSRADCEWDNDADAPAPGIFGPSNLPTLVREDWVHNCNDSYWATHPAEPITGFAAIIGDEESERSLRTRLCMKQIIDQLDVGSLGDAEGQASAFQFTAEDMKTVVLDSAVFSEQLARAAVQSDYCSLGTVIGSMGPVDISEACTVLASWDGKNNLDSAGGHIWREFWRSANGANLLWTNAFDASDPVNTPSGLATVNPEIQRAFADGVSRVASSPFAFDTPMGEIQFSGIHPAENGEDRIPIFGGEGFEGSFTIASARGSELSDTGYNITYGNSYIQVVTWDENDNPLADAFVTYSQSTDPASPYYRDMTEAYSAKSWIRLPFTEADIVADTQEALMLQE